jgi:fructose-1,6-bisphosphatase/inositol monophosphatase family enzyme
MALITSFDQTLATCDVCRSVSVTPDAVSELETLLVGCGGLIRELLLYSGGASSSKDDGQRLSVADRLVDRLLRERLVELFPGCSGYSEEGGEFGDPAGPTRLRWHVDPLDGTRSATQGGLYCVSAGALIFHEERPAVGLGWIYLPTLGVLYRGCLAPEAAASEANGLPARIDPELTADKLPGRYLAVGSDWHGDGFRRLCKITAPGATAAHLTQLARPGSDVVGVVLTRYRPYDAFGGLVIAAAAGAEVYRCAGESDLEPVETLEVLAEMDRNPSSPGPKLFAAHPVLARELRGGKA